MWWRRWWRWRWRRARAAGRVAIIQQVIELAPVGINVRCIEYLVEHALYCRDLLANADFAAQDALQIRGSSQVIRVNVCLENSDQCQSF